ncbi:bifunctional 3-oxoadipate enol-lactonase/4-carboxymuconolactone decarboxylase PcaDC [Aureimonas pseudogalii]|uniref:3-oxoadipate enol-lactonase/4-carboxymuconolactone decarboxylase n=1 Tax=Aureimonas pseudogalii TaxID=1744844 RepID=A0A7W6MLX1_9HYPH|nr:3-oxoadipate enol-lactonase [Aureimonas pseudogalii]MBB4000199.1 3-oxoadipate enol-lactonase/4-carboxymuconolactone decarboxylase [Aureimonas pseudogalii]
MPFHSVNGIVLHYRMHGTPGRPRLVFLNSLGSDLRIWDAVAERLRASHELLFYDLRGHGLSEATPAPYSIERHLADLCGLLDALGWTRVVPVGLSVGGLIAQAFAARHPERVEALVLMDTAARIGTRESWNDRIAAVEGGGLGAIGGAIVERWFGAAFRSSEPATVAGWRTMLERTSVAGYVGTCAALRDADLTPELPAIRAPTLVIAGSEDLSTPPDLVRRTAEGIVGGRFAEIAGAGHLPCIDRPTEVAELVAAHVAGAMAAPAARYDAGMAVRREVLGEAHVERAGAAITDFDRAFQRFITEGAWGTVWSGDHFTRRERSIVTIALLAALGQDEEVAMHVRATVRTGASPADIAEALMHVAVYAGVPAANHAIKIAKATLAQMKGEAAR